MFRSSVVQELLYNGVLEAPAGHGGDIRDDRVRLLLLTIVVRVNIRTEILIGVVVLSWAIN
jgi:hypothetical protein